jgi:hypothetical protein
LNQDFWIGKVFFIWCSHILHFYFLSLFSFPLLIAALKHEKNDIKRKKKNKIKNTDAMHLTPNFSLTNKLTSKPIIFLPSTDRLPSFVAKYRKFFKEIKPLNFFSYIFHPTSLSLSFIYHFPLPSLFFSPFQSKYFSISFCFYPLLRITLYLMLTFSTSLSLSLTFSLYLSLSLTNFQTYTHTHTHYPPSRTYFIFLNILSTYFPRTDRL